MPYPNEHSARVRDPGDFRAESFRRKQVAPGVSIIMGKLKGGSGSMTAQAYRFDKERFSAAEARKWLEDHDIKYESFEAARETKSSADAPDLITISIPLQIEAAAAGEKGEDKGPRKFSMVAYTGGPMEIRGWWGPVVVDLAGGRGLGKDRPVLREHNPAAIVGHGQARRQGDSRLIVEGLISGAGADAEQVVASAAMGFPWQASIGARVEKAVELAAGKITQVNGQTIAGPATIARRWTLKEISFVALGADENTSAKIAATAAHSNQRRTAMDFTAWLQAKGFDPEELTAEQRAALEAAYDAEQAKKDGEGKKPDKPAEKALTAAAGDDAGEAGKAPDPAGKIRQEAAAEAARIEAIGKIELVDRHRDIQAKAIAEGWTVEKTELAILRADRPKAPAIHAGGVEAGPVVLEAALRLGGSEPGSRVEKGYKPEVLEAAYKLRRIGIKQLVEICCRAEGRPFPGYHATPTELAAAGFSTISLPGLLGVTANKVLMDAYQAVPSVARLVAKKLSANDFKTHTNYRLTGDFKLKKIAKDGRMEHATPGEDSGTFKVDTYARIFGLTRQDIQNDDLNAFTAIPQMLGRGAAIALEEAFWTLVLANTGTYFGSANKNYISGGTSVLGATGLGKAVETFRKIVDADGNPVLINPSLLLVPPELEVTADELFVSTNYNTGGSATTEKVPNRNSFAGKYRPLCSPYLSNASFTGNSATAWYLFGDPADVAAFGIGYLNGVESPIVEDAPLEADILGQGYRGYLDFGVCQIDKRGAVKSAGV